ncbi:MAG: peptidylprolyl isomerase [Gemmatimonadota bacterium]
MSNAKQGDTVHVHYTGRLDDGTVFDSSDGRDPLQFVLGTGYVISGVEKAVEGMSVGEQVSTKIPPEEAYGHRSEELVLNVAVDQFPNGTPPKVGQRFQMTTGDGQQTMVTVTEVGDEQVEIDANHPLAGQELNFELELVKIA